MPNPTSLDNLKDDMARVMFGLTASEAHRQGICVECKESVYIQGSIGLEYNPNKIYSEAGAKEYRISGLCEACFDRIFNDIEEG